MTTIKTSDRRIDRRKFLQLSATYGATAVLGAQSLIAYAGEEATSELMEDQAKRLAGEQAKSRKKAEVVIRMGVSGDSPSVQERGFPTGYWEFARDVEERTDGRVQVQLSGGNATCTEITCAQRFATGALPAFGSSSQNAALTYPFLAAVDFPFQFPNRASMYHFLYSKKGDELYRNVLREKFDYEFLWALPEGRAIFLGNGWKDRPRARVPDDLRNAKIRVTASPMGRIALDLAGANPIPLDWAETYQGLNSGLIDGMENFPSAAPAFGMTSALSQMINLELFAGFEHAAIKRSFLDKLPDDLREAVMESAFHTQQWVQQEHEIALAQTVGLIDPPPKGTIFHEDEVAVNILTEAEKKEWVERCSPEHHPAAYEEQRERITNIAGGVDVYGEIFKLAREIPTDMKAIDVVPQRWWT